MKQTAYLWSVSIFCLALVVVLLWRVFNLENQVRTLTSVNGGALQDSLKQMQSDLAAVKEAAPGLGEYMTTIQLHAGKLWFAAQASNWDLAEYELDELKETMETAKTLNAEKSGVKISNVLDAVLETQVSQLADAIKHKSRAEFQKSYEETLSACNGCHTESGHQFIRIVRPSAPPVTNQKWELPRK